MKRNRNSDREKTTVRVDRQTLLSLDTQGMDTDIHEMQPEINNSCTPNVDIIDDTQTVVVDEIASASTITIERCLTLDRRLPILPLYPVSDVQAYGYPLLANIPVDQLTQTELIRRRSGLFKPAFDIITNNSTIPSFLREKYQFFYGDLIKRLKVDMSILDFNYTRLNKYLKMLIYEQIRLFNVRSDDIQSIEEKEYPLALEFFLQFDSLFCLEEPEARYELAACGNCGLCYPQYDMTYRYKKCVMEFNQGHQHKFVNGYRAILNCSASCYTQNIIYTLTCPCGKVDYIGVTKYSLNDRLQTHRQHGNRIMHEFLLGQENILRDLPRGKPTDILTKDRMKLYQHSVQCPVAIQIFLDANPRYWRFVPMSVEHARTPEQQNIQSPQLVDELDFNLRSKDDSFVYVQAVPTPPAGYTFSNRQIMLQTTYFHKKQDKILPNEDIDLYNATIVAVLPETCSDMFRYTIESFFITYAETNLNTTGNVLNHDEPINYYPLNNPWLVRGDEWCQGLLRRPPPKKPPVNTIAT